MAMAGDSGGRTGDDRSIAAAGLATAVAMAAILIAGTTCYDMLEAALRAGHRTQQATALADSLGQAAGGSLAGRTNLAAAAAKLEQRHAPLVAFAFVTGSGGVDEFGIARGASFTWGEPKDEAVRITLVNHAKGLNAVAEATAGRGETVPFSRLTAQLADGRLIVAVPYRAAGDDKTSAGVAGVVLKLQAPGPGTPGWVWLMILLCPLLLVAGVRLGRLPVAVTGIVSLLLGTALAATLLMAVIVLRNRLGKSNV